MAVKIAPNALSRLAEDGATRRTSIAGAKVPPIVERSRASVPIGSGTSVPNNTPLPLMSITRTRVRTCSWQ